MDVKWHGSRAAALEQLGGRYPPGLGRSALGLPAPSCLDAQALGLNPPASRPVARVLGLSTAPRQLQWSPSAELAPYISGYHLDAAGQHGHEFVRDPIMPGEASLVVVVSRSAGWRVRTPCGSRLPPAPLSLFGPSGALMWSESPPAVVVKATIRPRGWLRLLNTSAKDWANRIDQAPPVRGVDWRHFHAAACALSEDRAVPELFDDLFHRLLGPPSRHEARVDLIEAALLNPAITTVSELAGSTGLSARAIERISNYAFGFRPKLLLRRARFLRSLRAVQHASLGRGALSIDPAYTDYSHFIRDSHEFLGSAPQVFLRHLEGRVAARTAYDADVERGFLPLSPARRHPSDRPELQ